MKFYENNQTIKQSNNPTIQRWISLLGILVILLVGCQSEADFSEPPIEVDLKNTASFTVSEDLAKQIALGFFSSDSSFIAERKSKQTPKIREVARVSLADSLDFEAFVINESEGFVMIAGDSRVMPILAYSSFGKLNPEDFQEVNGLKVWYQETMSQIDLELKEIESVHPIVYEEWKKYSQDFDSKGRILDNSIASNYNSNCQEWYQYGQFMCSPYMTAYEKLPLYSYNPNDTTGIRWGQTGISNHMAPINNIDTCDCNDRSPIGCGTVAIAQTLLYFEPNTTYSYQLMPKQSNACKIPSTSGEISLALLMYNSAIAANTVFNYVGTCNGLTYPWDISPALEIMGMQDGGNTSNFNPWLLNNELYQGFPAIFYGHDGLFQWHIWTCDGFKQHNYKAYDCDIDGCIEWSYTWYYMNWGWDGGSNGWFASGVYSPGSSNYNNGLKMITGIR